MTNSSFLDMLSTLVDDPSAAGIAITTTYLSPLPTVMPPAGTLRASAGAGKPMVDVQGEFELPDGRFAVVLDPVGAQASRMEMAADELADRVGLPVIRFVRPNGTLLTTSARLSHRHADAVWRASATELTKAGVPFEAIQSATIHQAQPLLEHFPTSIPMGWWHSQTLTTDSKKRADATKNRVAALRGDAEAAEALAGYALMGPDMRSARVMASEIIATGVHRRYNMPAKVDSLLGPLSRNSAKGPSSLGLGSLPPVQESRATVSVSFDGIRGHWWFSLAGLRQFGFDADLTVARSLMVSLSLLLHLHAQQATRLRSGTELVASEQMIEVWRHGSAPASLDIPSHDELVEIVTALGRQIGWSGPREVVIGDGSVLDRIIAIAQADAEQPEGSHVNV